MLNIKIYVLLPEGVSPFLSNALFLPLFMKDDSAHHYEKWGSLAGIYWVWKNSHHEKIGIMSRRHFLSLNEEIKKDGSISGCKKKSQRHYHWSLKRASSLLSRVDVLSAFSYCIHDITILRDIYSPAQFYLSEGGSVQSLECILKIIKEDFSYLYLDAVEFIYGDKMIPWNNFIMRKDIFDEYCHFIFSVIASLKQLNIIDNKGSFQRNIWCLIAELLGNIYLKFLKKSRSDLFLREAATIYIEDSEHPFSFKNVFALLQKREKTILVQSPKKIHYGGRVNIILSFDDGYLKPACALLNSILAHTANGQEIDFYILHDEDLSRDAQEKLLLYYGKRTHLKFINIDSSFVYHFPLNRKHININSYYRLLIHNNLPSYIERVIYLDTDIIVCDDIVDFWNYDIGDASLAGCQDEEGIVESYKLFGKNYNHSYVNAGVLIVNLEKAKQKYGNLDYLYIESFYKNKDKIDLQDQDILNIAYKGDIFVLPLRWNLASSLYKPNKGILSYRGFEDGRDFAFSLKEEQEARLNPAILHYTGTKKPWKFLCAHYLKKFYWRYYFQTPNISVSLKEKMCYWNHYMDIHKGVLSLKIYGYKGQWDLRATLLRWQKILPWGKNKRID